ncbi:MAG: hypothetical protein Q8T03_06260 [Bacteroidota bacterium]|nr:hypothetical protein [Bacteroidota bacterium]
MNTFKKIIWFRSKRVVFFILLCFQFSFANAFNIKEDSLISKFPLNDPRNPHCPCHKYQKLADEEFKKLLGQEIVIKKDNDTSDFNSTFLGGHNLSSKISSSTKKYYSKKWRLKFLDFKKKKGTKRKRVKKLRKDNTSCFHF